MKCNFKTVISLVMILALSLSACGQTQTESSQNDSSATASQTDDSSAQADTSSKQQERALLQNTYKLLTEEKKLTIGYLGGSITYGNSAKYTVRNGKVAPGGGKIENSYVNRVSAWFKDQYPDAAIETVNAGISDTTTTFGIYRLKDHLMNENGHDMPDLVFLEFTSNDGGTDEMLTVQVESLVRNIREINPYAEIVVLSTTVYYDGNTSRRVYMDIAEHYGLPFVELGKALQDAKTIRGAASETNGTYYYTVDNLHPSAEGYALYADEIKKVLRKHLSVGTGELYDYKNNRPAVKSAAPLISNPTRITAENMTFTGDAKVVGSALRLAMFNTSRSAVSYPVSESYLSLGKGAVITAKFTGAFVGIMLGHETADINLRYRIDGGGWNNLIFDDSNAAGQKYEHTKVYTFAHDLSDGEHTLEIESLAEKPARIGAILTNG